MADETVTQQIVREAPEIEAYKLRLLQEAQRLAFNTGAAQPLSQQLPAYQVAAFTAPQQAAMQAAQDLGVGAFSPYMTAASQALGSAYSTTGEAADILRAADTRRQFADAQQAMQQALQAQQAQQAQQQAMLAAQQAYLAQQQGQQPPGPDERRSASGSAMQQLRSTSTGG